METNELLIQLKQEIIELKKVIIPITKPATVSEKWLPRKEVMNFLNYRATQMNSLEKSGDLVITKVGKRIFIHRDSIAQLLEKNKIQNS